MHLAPSEIIPLSPSQRKRLYGAVVMLYCLIAAFVEGKSTEATDCEVTTPRSRKQTYYCFVNKLAQICDSQRGGKTVTAFAVLQPGSVEYRFGCNERDASALARVTVYITDILNTLGKACPVDVKQATTDPHSPLFAKLLVKIIQFNRLRIERYVAVLADNLEICIERSSTEDTNEVREVITALEALSPLVRFVKTKPKVKVEEFVAKTQALLHAVDDCYESTLKDFIQEKCSEEATTQRLTLWDETYHAMGRLLSYFIAVKVLIKACRYWPELFEDFTVVSIPSSRPSRDPPAIRKSADRIIRRMTTDHAVINQYLQNATTLQSWGLDRCISEVTHHEYFKPIVHAEILVDDNVRRDQREAETTEPLHFFRQAELGRYIGASKPTCRLCALYFHSQPDGVTVRPSHHNMYYKWRAPDVFVNDGEGVKMERDLVLERIISKLRDAVFRAIREKCASWRPYDSNDSPTNPGVSDLTSQLSLMAVTDSTGSEDTPDTAREGSAEWPEDDAGDES